MVDEGSWYSRVEWPHDGHPVESSTFVVYGDRSSPDARREVAEVAEGLWAGLLDEFSVDASMLRMPDSQDKVHIYAYRDYYPQDWGMRAYYAGVVMWSPDHPQRPTDVDYYGPVLEHELVHVLESLLKGRDGGDPEMTDVWFSEGLAEAVVGGTAGGAVRSLHQMNGLTAEYGEVSPVSFKRDSQVTVPGAGFNFNYPMYQLATEYLLDADGASSTLNDARDLFLAMGNGASFQEAFNATIDIDLDEYEEAFYPLMDGYLPEYRTPLFSPIGYALFALAVFGTLVVVLAANARHVRRAAHNVVSHDAPRGGSGRLFRSEAIVSAGLALAFFLGIMFVVGTSSGLNNEMRGSDRATGYLILILYLGATTAVLILAQRLNSRQSRTAHLVFPGVIVATVITFGLLALVI